MRILVTGSTGYVGGRLVPFLLESGYQVRVIGRSVDKIKARPWANHPDLEIVKGDLLDLSTIKNACRGCHAVYYLVHSMNSQTKNFEATDRKAAFNMREAAENCGVERIIYLSGLGDSETGPLSKHLRSRQEVAHIFKLGKVPVTIFRAAMILGSGSASFEIMRYLVERLPIMLTPKWIFTRSQPIAIRNVLVYLRDCLKQPETMGQTFDIGGPDIVTYRELFDIYADEAGLKKRWIIALPFLSPSFSAYWIHFITPVPASIARPLAEGLRNEVLCRDNRIQQHIPQELLSCRQAIQLALERIKHENIQTCWSDAGCLLPPEWLHCGDAEYSGGTILECGYRVTLRADVMDIWNSIQRIGGKTGWYGTNFLWELRGILDRLIGGIGLRRGRRHPVQLMVGDALDFWRVLEISTGEKMILFAEMKAPGEAILEFHLKRKSAEHVELSILSRFLPRGILGFMYWYVLFPFHEWVFSSMLHAIAKQIDKPVVQPPSRFTPAIKTVCELNPEK